MKTIKMLIHKARKTAQNRKKTNKVLKDLMPHASPKLCLNKTKVNETAAWFRVSFTSEVFKLCHAVDPIEMPSLGGKPHGPRRTCFNLSYYWLGQNMFY